MSAKRGESGSAGRFAADACSRPRRLRSRWPRSRRCCSAAATQAGSGPRALRRPNAAAEGWPPAQPRSATPRLNRIGGLTPARVPILEYHVLGAASAGAPYPDLFLRRPIFHRQMCWLPEPRYEAATPAAPTIHPLLLHLLDDSALLKEDASPRAT